MKRLDLADLIRNANAGALFDALIRQPLALCSPPDRKIVIVVDALDEAAIGNSNELADLLASGFQGPPEWLRLLVTSRPDPDVISTLQGLEPFPLDIGSRENQEDIREYLRRELLPLTGGAAVPEDVIETILAKSEGVFLYVHWIRQELEKPESGLLLDRVQEFPQGLGGVYVEFFKRQFGDVAAYDSEVQPALGVIAAAHDALPEDILTAIFGWDDLQREKFFDSLGSLFSRREGKVYPFHLSILDWLTTKARAGEYFVSVAGGHKRLAGYCWNEVERYIAEDRQLRDRFQAYAFRHGVRHMVESGQYAHAVDLLDYLVRHEQKLRPEDRADLDQFAKLIAIALGQAPPEEAEAALIDPHKLARLIKGLYMSEPLRGCIGFLLEHYRPVWPELLEDFLSADDYVLRHAISEALAEDYLQSRQTPAARIHSRPDRAPGHQSSGSGLLCAGAGVCRRPLLHRPDIFICSRTASMSFRSVLGDLLLSLALQDAGDRTRGNVEILKQVGPSTSFWNPSGISIAWTSPGCAPWIPFVRGQELPADAPGAIRDAYQALLQTEKLRKTLLERPAIKASQKVRKALEGYYHRRRRSTIFAACRRI